MLIVSLSVIKTKHTVVTIGVIMKMNNSSEKIWLSLKNKGISDQLNFLCKHFWQVHYALMPHAHSTHEFIFVSGGMGTIISQNVAYNLSQGDLLLVEPNSIHEGVASPDNPFEIFTIGYNLTPNRFFSDPALFGLDSIFMELFKAFKDKTKLPVIYGCHEIKNIIYNLICELNDNKSCRKELIRAYLIQFFALLIRKLETCVDKNRLKNVHIEAIVKAKNFMQDHFNSPITLVDISGVACLSPSHFCRIFKKQTSSTPIEYLNNLRMEKAKTLLLHSNFTLTEIADKVGFSSIHYFSRCFKKLRGISPLSYRQDKNMIEHRPDNLKAQVA
jgi:AraC-like DNA-binding protein/mannose-6-phosphate isomerase-like protein (cupin superfamily)